MCSFFCEAAFPCSVGPVGMLKVVFFLPMHCAPGRAPSSIKTAACARHGQLHFEKALTFLPNPAVDWQIEDFNDKGAGPWTFFLPFCADAQAYNPCERPRRPQRRAATKAPVRIMSTTSNPVRSNPCDYLSRKSCAASIGSPRPPSAPHLPRCHGSASSDPAHGPFKAAARPGSLRDADPRRLYRDALIVLDQAKRLNNGQPSLWAYPP